MVNEKENVAIVAQEIRDIVESALEREMPPPLLMQLFAGAFISASEAQGNTKEETIRYFNQLYNKLYAWKKENGKI